MWKDFTKKKYCMQLFCFLLREKKIVFSLLWFINHSWISEICTALFPQSSLSKIYIHYQRKEWYQFVIQNQISDGRICTCVISFPAPMC